MARGLRARDWQARHGGQPLASRAKLQAALSSRRVDAGVIVRSPWLGEDRRPQGEQFWMWLGHRVQPAAAARLRAELTFSMLQVQMNIAVAEAGHFASVLLSSEQSEQLLTERSAPAFRYLYEIESGRPMTAVQQSVPAWLVFGMFFVVIPVAGVLIQERNSCSTGSSSRSCCWSDAGWCRCSEATRCTWERRRAGSVAWLVLRKPDGS